MPHGQRRLSDRDHGILKLVESLHAHVALCAPSSADHMAQSGTDQHQRRMTVREGACHLCPSADLPVQPLQHVGTPDGEDAARIPRSAFGA